MKSLFINASKTFHFEAKSFNFDRKWAENAQKQAKIHKILKNKKRGKLPLESFMKVDYFTLST